MLSNLQGNILKGHGRDFTWNIFFRFGADTLLSKRAVRELGNYHVTDAYTQLLANEAYKTEKKDGGTFLSLFLSSLGYAALGLEFKAPEENKAFESGMRDASSIANLADPAVDNWEDAFKGPIHGMVLVADDTPTRGVAAAEKIEEILTGAGAAVIHIQAGKALRNAVNLGIEHFGYVDGRSQPLMLLEDIEKESREDGISRWDSGFPLGLALVPDPLAKVRNPQTGDLGDVIADPTAFGSFFVFRKLEQNVAGFKTEEQRLANDLLLNGGQRLLAGALVVGRFEDGTPVTLSPSPKGGTPTNDFDYDGDLAASRCPFHAHVRKTNPRGTGGFEPEFNFHTPSALTERSRLMPRRGITYEDTTRVPPTELPQVSSEEEFKEKVLHLLPSDGVGLLFMAYNSKLDQQFVFTQQTWANNLGFPNIKPDPGRDGVIGQDGNIPGGQLFPKVWDDPASGTESFDFGKFVTMKGGEYFFAPSLVFLRNI